MMEDFRKTELYIVATLLMGVLTGLGIFGWVAGVMVMVFWPVLTCLMYASERTTQTERAIARVIGDER